MKQLSRWDGGQINLRLTCRSLIRQQEFIVFITEIKTDGKMRKLSRRKCAEERMKAGIRE